MDDNEAQARGARAANLLSNDLLQEAFKKLEDEYITAWRRSEATNQIGREKLFLAVNVIGKVREHLEEMVSSGKIAAKTLEALAKEADRKKRFGVV